MQNQWLKSILGEFQGYINEVKQNAQAQGINADFLDLQDGVLNHKAVVGELTNSPKKGLDVSNIMKHQEIKEAFLWFAGTQKGFNFLSKYAKKGDKIK